MQDTEFPDQINVQIISCSRKTDRIRHGVGCFSNQAFKYQLLTRRRIGVFGEVTVA